MIDTPTLEAKFAQGVPYDQYLAHAKPHERPGWEAFGARVSLTRAQCDLVAGFSRRINVLCVSGTWCGDCVQQCPILAKIAAAGPVRGSGGGAVGAGSPGIDLRFLEREAHMDLSDRVKICGGNRVPTVIFMNEAFEFVALLGDRTLSRYRAVAAKQLGPSCPLPGAPVPEDEVRATVQDWVDEFERVALLLRLSQKLRAKHGD
jgi:thiol-disulfide isomerase/thioredoxin